MPVNPRSLQATEAYRRRVIGQRKALQARAEAGWPSIERFDRTDWPARMAAAVTQGQIEAVRLTSAYLGAFLTLETGERTPPPAIDTKRYVGLTRDGRPLTEAFRSPLIGVLAALKDGESAADALRQGLERATRLVGVDYDHAHRQSMMDLIAEDDRFDGWSRSVAGTCGACAAAAAGIGHSLWFPAHPGCACVSTPVVTGVPDLFPVLTGQQIFDAKTPEEQDEMLGPEAAELLRTGAIQLEELRQVEHMETGDDFISQKPIKALNIQTQEV